MTWLILPLLGVGAFLSALFSGSETGFYRVTRVRLLLDTLGGDKISRALLWLTNNPALFVAATLVGNNLANYCLSFGIVLAIQLLFSPTGLAPLIAPMVLSPVVFIYCELIPKQLFFHAPNRLLRRSGPLLVLFTICFAPVAGVLWLFGRALETLVGQTPLRVRLTLARKELQGVLREGQHAGILLPAQHELAQRLFTHSSQNVLQFSTPLGRIATITPGTATAKVLKLARKQQTAIVPVRDPMRQQIVGYVRVVDLCLAGDSQVTEIRPVLHIQNQVSHIECLMEMRAEKAELACVEDRTGKTLALVYASRLTAPLFDNR